jgi:hypothetical protein
MSSLWPSRGRHKAASFTPADTALAHMPRFLAYLVAVIAVWSIIGRYWGMQHDALGYTLQAVAKLKPNPLAGDIFLRFRSQDEFTVFPQLCAFFVARLGVDHAASLLTFSFLFAWVTMAWLITRRLEGRLLALLSVGLLLVIPGWYSAGEVFRYLEPFLTARGLAEALVLGAVYAALCSRRLVAVGCLAIALVVHPLMAFPGVLLVAALWLPLAGWKYWAFGAVLVLGAIIGSYVLTLPQPLMDADWLRVTRSRSGFLFFGEWIARDREVAAQTLLTLAAAAVVLPAGEARRLAAAALCVAGAGMLLMVIASEILPAKLLLQGQPWRWMWIGRFLATALLPLLFLTLWRSGVTGQAAALLTVCAWLLTDSGSSRDVPPVGVGGMLCLAGLALWSARQKLSPGTASVLRGLAWSLTAVVVASFVSIIVIAARNNFSFGHDPVWVQRATDVIYTPGIVVLWICAAWYASFAARLNWPSTMICAASLALLVGAMPETLRRWTDTPFGAEQRGKFAAWRQRIPTDAEVLWHEAPQAVWLLLDRRSYLTVSQAAGGVFSRQTTDEIVRRAHALSALVAPGVWWLDPSTRQEKMKDLTPDILRSICQDPSLGFVVSRFDLGISVALAEWPGKADFVYLYDCAPYRRATVQ